MPSPPPLLEAVVLERLMQASPKGRSHALGVLLRFVASNAEWAA